MKEKIVEILRDINEDIVKYEGNNMLGDMIIDSFDIMQIIAELEEEYHIEVDAKYVVSENFATIDTIVAMMQLCMKGCEENHGK